jgi:chromosomal replication initiation ATPase DnaA
MLENVLKVVGAEFGVSRAQLLSATRSSPDVAWARQVAMWLYFQAGAPCNYSLVGREFNRDRTTVRHAVAKANRLLSDQDADRLVTNVRAITSV